MEPGIEGKDDAHHGPAVLMLARNTQATITNCSFTCSNARSVACRVPRSAAFSLASAALRRVTRAGIPAQKINSLGQSLLQSSLSPAQQHIHQPLYYPSPTHRAVASPLLSFIPLITSALYLHIW